MRSTADRIRRAATLGSDVPRGEFPVRVHSVFHAALNLSSADGDLLTLLSAEADDLPRGVRLASVEDFSTLGLAAGDQRRLRLRRDRARPFGGSRGRCGWIAPAARRLAAPSAPPLRDDDARWRAGVAQLETLQERAATDLRIAPLLTLARPSGAMGERSDAGGARSRPRRAGRTPRRHVRRGGTAGRPGAGPDARRRRFSLRFLRCRLLSARPPAWRARVCWRRSRRSVRELLGQTTDISASFLRDALAGRVSRSLAALAEACSGAPGGDLDGALLRLAAIGHSSGLDAATGFFYGAFVWRKGIEVVVSAPS